MSTDGKQHVPEGTDEQVVALAEIQREAFRLAHEEGDPASGIAHLEPFLARELDDEVRGEALAFRAILLEMEGRFDEARASLLDAHRRSAGSSFRRYGIEIGLQHVFERLGDPIAARGWCRAALDTAAADASIDGSGTVRSLLTLSGGQVALTEAEISQCRSVIRQARQLRGLPAAEDLDDLSSALEALD